MLGIRSFLVFALLAGSPLLSAQEIPTPWSWPITSDYGPRDRDDGLALKWNFHKGIDYGGTEGENIPAVEAGVIEAIGYGGGWYIAVKNTGVNPERRWTYMHIFSGTNPAIPVTSGNWELRSANLKKTGTTQIYTSNVIIRWSNKPELKAEKALSIKDYDGMEVYIGATPVLNTSGATITSSGTVSQHDSISPVGTSGGVPQHLHLGLDKGENNPLLYLIHDPDGEIAAEITSPPEGHLFRSDELNALYPIKVQVNSTTGLDMDKVNLVIVDPNGTRHLVGHWSQPLFSYGGRSDREDYGGVWNSTTVVSCGSGPACVTPLDANPATAENNPGLDEFTYPYPFGSLYLPDGQYRLEAVVSDVNKNQYFSPQRSFRIDTTQPIFHLSSISPLYDNFRGTSTLTPSTLERAHTLDFEDAVAGISALVITGPEEFPGYSHIFNPPVSTTTLSFTDMPLGPYEIRAVDAVGNESIAPFRIADLDVVISTADSQFYGLSVSSVPYGDIKFGCRLAVKTESSLPIERLDIYQFADGENSRNLVKSIQGSDISAVTYFDTGINTSVFFSAANYLFQVWDKGGSGKIKVIKVNYHWEQFPSDVGVYSNAYREDGWVTVHPGAGEGAFTGTALDLLARPALMGGTVLNLGPGWPYFTNKNAEIISGVAATLDKVYNLPLTDSQEFGTVEAHLLTSDNADMSGAVDVLIAQTRHFATPDPEPYRNNGSTCGASGYSYSFCYTDTAFPEIALPLKRYSQIKLVLNVPAPSGILHGNCISGDASMCSEGYAASLKANFNAYMSGAAIEPEYFYLYDGKEVLPGENVSVPLGSGVSVTFDSIEFRGGYVGLTVQSGDTLPGFTAIPDGHSYNITSGLTFDGVTLAFPFDPSGLTSGQQGQLKVVRVVDQAKGIFEELLTTVDSANSRISARATSFGKFMVVAPAYATPHPVNAGNATGGAELEFVSNSVVSAEKIAETSIFSDVMLKNLKSNNLVPVGNVYYIGPANTQLYPAGAIKMRYDPAKLAALGIPDSDIGLYEFTSDGSLMFKLPRQSIRGETSEITAAVPALYSLFAVLAKSHEPAPADIMLPETLLGFDGNVYLPESGKVYIATTTKVMFNPSDWEDAYSTGLLASYYFRDRHPDFVCLKTGRDILKPAGTCENPLYNSAFTLEEGTHTIYYQSVDHAKNFELIKSTEVYVDGTPPVVELFVGTISVADGGSAYVAVTDSITLSYFDPETNMVASGIKAVYRFVDMTPEECIANDPPAACAEVESTEPFTLSGGTHTIYYTVIDQVGNIAAVKSAFVTVATDKYENPAQWPYYEFVKKFGVSGGGNFFSFVVFDADGNLLTEANSEIQKYTPEGEFISSFGLGQISSVRSMAACSDGNIWVDDLDYTQGKFRLKKFSTAGILLEDINLTGRVDLLRALPVTIACGKSNNLYILGVTGSTWHIFRFDVSGNFAVRLPIEFPTQMTGLISDKKGNLYTRSRDLNVVYKYSPEGQLLFEWTVKPEFSAAGVDDFGNIYLHNGLNTLDIYHSTGGVLTSFGSLPNGYTQEAFSASVPTVIHPQTGRIYVVSAGKIKIYGLDHTAPDIPKIYSHRDTATIYSQTPILLGRRESKSTLQIYEGSALLGTISGDVDGWLNAKSPTLNYGTHLLKFRSRDLAGNLSEFTPEVSLSVKSVYPAEFSSLMLGPRYPEVPPSILDTSATAVADFDRDGKMDIVGFSHHGLYALYKGDGTGGFKYVYNMQIPGVSDNSGGDDAVAVDFNNDGKMDMAASINNSAYPFAENVLMLFYGNGDGTFQAPVLLDHLLPYAGIASGDFDNDGTKDLVSSSNGRIKVYLNGPAPFLLNISTPIPAEAPGTYGGGVAMADFDGDARVDILFRNAVLFADALGGFDSRTILPHNTADISKALASDLNNDGRKDVVLVTRGGVASYINYEYRSFVKTQLTLTGDSGFYGGGTADFNGDGVTDLAVSPYSLQQLRVLLGLGDGTFSAAITLPTPGGAFHGSACGTLITADLNGDWKTDILQASSISDRIDPQLNTFFSYLNNTFVPDTIPPAKSLINVKNEETGGAAVFWQAPGDDGDIGAAQIYDLRYSATPIITDTDFNAAKTVSNITTPRQAGETEAYTITDLSGGTTYYFALKTYDEAGNASLLSNSPLVVARYVVKTTNTIDGNAEIGMVSAIQPYITEISSASEVWAVAIGSANAQFLTIASRIYEIGPEGIYDPPAALAFYYSTSSVAAAGLAEADLAIYEYFAGIGWKKLEGQVIDKLNHKITVPVTNIASLFGIFGVVRDRVAPETDFFVVGSSWPMAGGGLYLGAASSITLAANDPVVFGTATGVAFTEFRIDASSSAPFARYQDSLNLSTGPHKVGFRSVDNSGNTEEIRSVGVFVDGQAPDLGYSIAGSSFAGVGVVYAALGSTVTLASSDAAAGVNTLFYEFNGATHTAASSNAEIFLHSGGAYLLSYFAEDNVGNMTSTAAVSLFVDTSAPVSALLLENALARDGWYTSALAAALVATDEGSGIRETLFSLDGSSFAVYAASFPVVSEGRHTIGFYSSDNVLNEEAARTSSFGIDTSTPIVSYALAPVPNAAGWNNSAVGVLFSGTDTVSGVEHCSSSFTISGEGLNIPASGYCADYAGWSSTAAFSVSIDTTMPVSSADVSGASGLNGWFVSPAIVALAATDNLSGLDSLNYSVDGSSFTTYGSSVAVAGAGWHVLRYYAQDTAGNLEAEKRAEFKLDLNAPSVTSQAEPQPNEHGWNNTAVRFVFSGTDTVSGLASCEGEKTIELEGSSWTVTGYCMDFAGWSSTATLSVSIDTTAPVLSYIALPSANELGWNNGDVSLKFACEDNLSGVMACPADILLSGEGINISTAAKAYDYAGNFSQVAVSGLKIDRKLPISSAALSGAFRNGWYAGTVGVVLSSTDALSGVKQIFYSLDAGGVLAYTGPLTVLTEGSHSLKFYAEDNAGNAEAAKTITFSIDASAPIVAYSQTPAANAAGWNNSSVDVVFSGTDTFSGIEGCSSGTITFEGAARSVPGWCRDLAGNIGYATATLNIDMTPAGITIAAPQAGQTFIATRGRVDISFTVADNLDPTPGVEAFLVQLEDKGSPRGQRPGKIAVAAGQSIEPLDIDDGVWQLLVSATDFALNASSAASGAFEMIHDVLPPRSELAVSGALYGSAIGAYVTSAAKFSLTSIDDLVSPEDGIGLGVKDQSVSLKSGALTLKELTFLAPAPQPGVVFVSTFSLGSLGSLPDGSYDVSYAARDVIGNAAASIERRYLLDNTAPFTQYAVAGIAHLADGKLYINSTAALSLSGVDVSSGGVAAGLMLTKYRLDDGNWLIYSSSFAISAAGTHTMEYYSLDNVQNAESIRTLSIVVDNTAPATAISVGEPQFNVFGLWIMTPETPVTLAAADAGAAGLAAGVNGIYYELITDGGGSSGANTYTEPFKIGAQGTYTVRYWSLDNAGNAEMPKELRLMVSSLQSDALDAVEGLAMTGSADIAGTVKSNKVVSLGGNARILGDVNASTITVTGNAQITGQRFAGTATLAPAPLYMPAIVEIASNTNNNSLIPAKYLVGGKLVVSAKDEIILSTGIYYLTGIELKGGASVALNGKVDILVTGDVAISGGSSFNAAGTASRLNIFLSTTSTLNFSGGASLAAYVYAPYAELKLAGNALLGGHYFARSAAVSGNGNILQAGESLPSAAPTSGGGKKVSAFGSSSSYSVLVGPDPEFKLGEVYVYPNPAKNGQVPTIHLECGIADSVNIKIYTVSGREAHEYTITSAPAVLDDGNGLSYAYEYAWNGRIPSGVYYYFIEAERAGKKIKKTGKFAVVR